ncbi:MAG TPA: hypothetical protein VF043_25615, partial [Ktedonobacteraceae bacterium]
GSSLMSENEFRQPVSIDFAPRGSVCEWCGKPATQQLTVIGGKSHNEGGVEAWVAVQTLIKERENSGDRW